MILETVPLEEQQNIFHFTNSWEKKGEIKQALNLILRRANRRCGQLSSNTVSRIEELSLEQLEALDVKLDEIEAEEEIIVWLNER